MNIAYKMKEKYFSNKQKQRLLLADLHNKKDLKIYSHKNNTRNFDLHKEMKTTKNGINKVNKKSSFKCSHSLLTV